MPRQRGACLLVLIGKLHHQVAQRAAVRAALQGSTLKQGVTPAPQTAQDFNRFRRCSSRARILLGAQRHHRHAPVRVYRPGTFDMQALMRSVLDDLARLPRVSRATFPVRDPMTDLLD